MKNRVDRKVTVGSGDDKTEVEIYVVKPKNDVLKRAERYKSKTWNECIQDGILTKKELGVLMRERGIWDEKKDKEETAITEKILELEKQLYHGKNGKKQKVSVGRDISIEIRKKRSELRDLITEKITLEENTADNLADNARFDYLVAHCTFNKDGTPFYKDFEEYNNTSADEVAFAAAEELGKLLYNLDQKWEKNLPENKFLDKFNLINEDLNLVDPNDPERLIDTKGNRIDKEGYYIDEEGNRVDVDGHSVTEDGTYAMEVEYENDLVVEKPKPKRAPRKKKTETTETES